MWSFCAQSYQITTELHIPREPIILMSQQSVIIMSLNYCDFCIILEIPIGINS